MCRHGPYRRSIMRIALIFLRWLMNFIYLFMKLCPIRSNKLVFLSRQSNTPSEDFLFLQDKLLELDPDMEIVTITQRVDNNLKSMLSFAGVTLKSMYHLATARICVWTPIGRRFPCCTTRRSLRSSRCGTP